MLFRGKLGSASFLVPRLIAHHVGRSRASGECGAGTVTSCNCPSLLRIGAKKFEHSSLKRKKILSSYISDYRNNNVCILENLENTFLKNVKS